MVSFPWTLRFLKGDMHINLKHILLKIFYLGISLLKKKKYVILGEPVARKGRGRVSFSLYCSLPKTTEVILQTLSESQGPTRSLADLTIICTMQQGTAQIYSKGHCSRTGTGVAMTPPVVVWLLPSLSSKIALPWLHACHALFLKKIREGRLLTGLRASLS